MARFDDGKLWPRAILACFLVFIGVEVRLLYLATTGFEGAEVHYYNRGLEFSKEVRRQRTQRQLGWSVDTVVTGSGLKMEARDRSGQPLDGKVQIHLGQPATRRGDRDLEADLRAGRAVASWTVPSGVWNVEVEVEAQGFVWKQKHRIRT